MIAKKHISLSRVHHMQHKLNKKSANGKMRKHKQNKSPKTYVRNLNKASDKEKSAYNDMIKHGTFSSDTNVNIGRKRTTVSGNEKYVIVNPKSESQRVKEEKYMKIMITFLTAIALIITVISLIDFFFSTAVGQQILQSMNGDPKIENGNLIFSKTGDYVTVGDSVDTAVEILGSPTLPKEDQNSHFLYYNDSYLLIENDRVIGYYKASGDKFNVSVGSAAKDINRMIFLGDSAKRVIEKLGSPDHYIKDRWIYFKINLNYEKTSSDNGKTLTVYFDDEYKVKDFILE